MKAMKKKCHLIDWRDKVEETVQKLDKGERLSLEQIVSILEEGYDKSFLEKKDKYFTIGIIEESDPTFPLRQNFASLTVLAETY